MVEGDGTLVPATDDDVMEVEHMLKDDKKDAPSIESMEKFQDYVSDAVLSSRKSGIVGRSSLSESSVGSSQKLNARLENSAFIQEDKSAAEAPYWSSGQDVTGASGGDSDDSGDIRRKHHRAWTLWEVTKLIEGVSKYGAGRWSEIKRLAFPSYTQRTSVDLKDKWRNLLRACFTQRPAENRNTRRHNSAPPIPTWVLARVRELSEMQQAHQRIGGFGSTKAARSMARFKYVGARGSMGVSRDPLAAATTYHRPLHLATLGICSTFNVGLGGFETLGSMKIRLCPSHLQDPESTWSIGGRQP
ncbi:unnamed protein product [Spirodela intermedia]|uniref:Uncharacterized protein n=1 Tax=Spirodela intermedia TaxID=51605 RepID=A0A7I8INF3_SPIIN|nr:unnamed protein product [Spirodela intermedia]CAA6659338.1 unnamed protein product [Spirodela intermedia]